MALGYVGLGNMGALLVKRLRLEHEVAVYDLSPAAVDRAAGMGATPCASLRDLAARCDTILLCLPTSTEVRAALYGEDGLLAGAAPGTLIVDQTTGDPVATRAMAADLAPRGIDLIDAPVSGGRRGAETGTIAIMVGAGPDQFARIERVLRCISPNVFHAGGVGAGHVMKLVNNMLSGAQRMLSFEGMALAVKNGIDPKTAASIINAGSGRNYYMERFMGPQILEGKLNSGFTLGLVHKDVRLATQLGIDSGVPLLLGNITREFYQICINQMGKDEQVNSAGLVMDRLAGTQVIPADYSLT